MEWDTEPLMAIVPGPVIEHGMAYIYAASCG